jgi:sodium-dependent dicarboxylate transporter 2/3/5
MISDNDTRRQSQEFVGTFKFSTFRSAFLSLACVAVASAVAYVPQYTGLLEPARAALFILLVAALLWITEAIPAFATSLLVIGMEIALLGQPGGGFAETNKDYEQFLAPWGSPLIWLFFAGFIMAAAAEKTGLDRVMAGGTLGRFGRKPAMLVLGTMGITALLSMFMSNTATATLMLTALTPLAASRPKGDSLTRSLMLSVAFASNIGGMGTVIGTPPNAIAAGALSKVEPINFAEWMVLAVPAVAVLLAIAWLWIVCRYLWGSAWTDLESLELDASIAKRPPGLHQAIVVATFVATVGLWLTGPLHNLPTTVVSFLPICTLTTTGILTASDIRKLPWDVLLLIAGGLSLGVAIDLTGLAAWLVSQMPMGQLGMIAVVVAFGYITVTLSNLMSNTAATNIVVPIVIAVVVAQGGDARLIVPVALAASCAMCLPISTPPNAIVFSSGRLSTSDLLFGGLIIAVVGPAVCVAWSTFALGWLK